MANISLYSTFSTSTSLFWAKYVLYLDEGPPLRSCKVERGIKNLNNI